MDDGDLPVHHRCKFFFFFGPGGGYHQKRRRRWRTSCRDLAVKGRTGRARALQSWKDSCGFPGKQTWPLSLKRRRRIERKEKPIVLIAIWTTTPRDYSALFIIEIFQPSVLMFYLFIYISLFLSFLYFFFFSLYFHIFTTSHIYRILVCRESSKCNNVASRIGGVRYSETDSSFEFSSFFSIIVTERNVLLHVVYESRVVYDKFK